MGRKWLSYRRFAALRVPSVMLPYGKAWNLVLNPMHPEFASVGIVEVVPLPLDTRLLGKLSDNKP